VPDVSEVAGGPDTPPRDTMSTQRSIRHTDRHEVLSDGRRLTYADLGDPESMPVLYFHSRRTPTPRHGAGSSVGLRPSRLLRRYF
jgi:hypothetical protein